MKKITLILLLIMSGSISRAQDVTLNIRAFIQGYYRPSLGKMVAVIDSVNHPAICDTLKVNLTDTVDVGLKSSVLFSSTSLVTTDGYASFTFPAAVLGGTYFIQLVHRSALTVFSKYCITFSASPFFYDFTVIPSTIAGDNADTSAGVALIWNGDVYDAANLFAYHQDGVIEDGDYGREEFDSQSHFKGYFPTDLTGDNIVDSNDYALMEQNYQSFLFKATPKFCSPTGIIDSNSLTSETRLFPNPASSFITVSFPGFRENGELAIYNSLGAKISEISLIEGDRQAVLDVSNLAKGIYICRLQSERKSSVTKFIKQ